MCEIGESEERLWPVQEMAEAAQYGNDALGLERRGRVLLLRRCELLGEDAERHGCFSGPQV